MIRRAVAVVLLALACLPALATPSASVKAVLQAAQAQVGVTVHYDPSYVRLDYPGGDVSADRGVCSDVVIRALRAAGIDLQKAVHEDMRRNFSAYPKLWGLSRTDRNIDHRRVPNLETFFRRQGWAQPVLARAADYLPGDLVTWRLPGNLPHIGIVTEQRAPDGSGRRLIAHNVGAGAKIEDVLYMWPQTAHFRPVYPPAPAAGAAAAGDR